jgi:hypothetical protein
MPSLPYKPLVLVSQGDPTIIMVLNVKISRVQIGADMAVEAIKFSSNHVECGITGMPQTDRLLWHKTRAYKKSYILIYFS